MEFQGGSPPKFLPGSDSLKTAHLFDAHVDSSYDTLLSYYQEGGHRQYLDNKAYSHYIHIHKVVVGESGANELLEIAKSLETEDLPVYLDAAGWAYAEAALATPQHSTVERVSLIDAAESLWEKSLVHSAAIGEILGGEYRYGDSEGHRTALNLAFAPLMKSIVVGNVRPEIVRKTLIDTAEIAHDSRNSLQRAYSDNDKSAAGYHKGFLFEASALMMLLYMDDSRYVPLPATARSDTGYYHREQTHDISLINQHWGEIRKIIPIEIKSKASQRDKRRYKALIIPGRMRLALDSTDPQDTIDTFYDLVNGRATAQQNAAIEQLSTQLREMLRLYQKGVSAEGLAIHSLTRFHDSKTVAQQYPELSVKPKPA